MRLLYTIDSLAPGGAETSLAAMAPILVNSGIDLHVLPLGTRVDLAPQLEAAGATVHGPLSPQGRLANVRSVLHVARTVRVDLVHTTLYEADISGRTAARIAGLPCTTSLVNQTYGRSHVGESQSLKLTAARLVDKWTARWGTRFHAVSEAVAREVGPVLRVPASRIDVIPRGRDPRLFPYRDASLRAKTRSSLSITPTTPVVLGVGRLEPQKGFQHLLHALPRVAESYPDAVVLIAGRAGRASESLRALSSSSPLKVHFLGARTDIPALLSASDVLAFPSEREGSPGTLIEAMATGTAIVASDIAPCQEVLGGRNPPTALMFPAGNPADLARAIIETLGSHPEAEARSLSARARFESHYTIDSVSLRMVQFFEAAKANYGTSQKRGR